MEREKRISYFEIIYKKLVKADIKIIEESLIKYIKVNVGMITLEDITINKEIYSIFIEEKFPIDIEYIIEFFEFLLDKEKKDENGIVFTPKYISDFIINDCFKNIKVWDKNIKLIDPGCGCGIFLISAIEYIHNRFKVDVQKIPKVSFEMQQKF